MNDLTSSLPPAELPLVAIVGRPNVGKSTLFNRLIGRRKAITDPTPGVTRDLVSGTFDINGRSLSLVDTGGVTFDKEGLNALVTKKSLGILDRAVLVILVMEVGEITAEDHLFIEMLRPYTEKILLAVNKADHEGLEQQVWEFHSFGFSDVVPISATHGRGCDRLLSAIERRIPQAGEIPAEAAAPYIRVSILGKPNTGKSTLLNALTDSDSSIVSDIPGTTRDVVEGRFSYHEIGRASCRERV